MEGKYPQIRGAGLGLAAISYDSPAILKNFSERHHIEFPLLADVDSTIIRKFGILNEEAKKGTPFYGIPYPGIYILDSHGVVKAKFFENDYRERDTAGMILLRQFGITPDEPHTPIAAKHLELSATATDSHPHVGQRISLVLDVSLPRDIHVYAPGVKGYIAIDWQMPETAAAKIGEVTYPQSKQMNMPAIQEIVPVYEDHFRLVRDITLGGQKELSPLLDQAGRLNISGTFRYQACDSKQCFIPETIPVNLTLQIEALDRTRVPENLQRKSN